MTSEEYYGLLDDQDWGSIIIRLSAYAVSYCIGKRIELPGGKEPEDVAMDAIDRVYSRHRNWDPDGHPDIFEYLKSVVNSIISNELSTAARKGAVEGIEEADEVIMQNDVEEEMYCRKLDEEIGRRIGGDAEMSIVYKGLKDRMLPREIAEEFYLEIEVVRNAQKRLQRLAIKAIKNLSKAQING
jgi:hypothetical protein